MPPVYLHGRDCTKAVAEELLQSDGNCPDGRFLVRPSGGNHILTVGFKGRCTHHKLAKNEDGMMAVGGKTLGLTTTKPTDVIARIAKEPLPKGWPVLLVEAVTPDGSFKTTFLSGQGGAKGDSKPASKAVKPRDKAPTNPEAQPSTKPLEKQEKAESTQKGAEKALPTKAVTKSPQKTATSTESPFAVGDRVEVESYGEGIVRFVGSHHSTGNERVGVQLDRANGNNNGTIKGHTYFECPPKCGVLVAPSKCSKVDAVSQHATLPTEAPRTIHESTAQDQVVTLERPDTSASFGFGLAEVYTGWAEKWATVVSEASIESPLEVGARIVALESVRPDGTSVRVDLSSGTNVQHQEAIAALRQAGTTLRLTLSGRRVTPAQVPVLGFTQRGKRMRRTKVACGDTVYCRCPKCAAEAIAEQDATLDMAEAAITSLA